MTANFGYVYKLLKPKKTIAERPWTKTTAGYTTKFDVDADAVAIKAVGDGENLDIHFLGAQRARKAGLYDRVTPSRKTGFMAFVESHASERASYGGGKDGNIKFMQDMGKKWAGLTNNAKEDLTKLAYATEYKIYKFGEKKPTKKGGKKGPQTDAQKKRAAARNFAKYYPDVIIPE